MVIVNHNMALCSQCMECIENCPGAALSYTEGVFLFAENNCTVCESCMMICDSNAIEVKI